MQNIMCNFTYFCFIFVIYIYCQNYSFEIVNFQLQQLQPTFRKQRSSATRFNRYIGIV